MFNRVIVPDFTPRQPHVVQQVGAQIPPPAPVAPPVVAAASPPVLKPIYTTLVGDYRQQAPVIVPAPVTVSTQQGTPLAIPTVYTIPYTTVASTTASGYSPNLETYPSGSEPYFKLASAPSEAADWWQYPAAGPVDMSGNDLNMNSGSITAATTIGTTDISATRQMACSSLGANFVTTKALSSLQAFISSLNTNYISSQVGTISSLSTSIITLDGATLTTAGGTELLLNGIPVATTANLSSLSDWSLDPAISTIDANSNNIIGVNDLQVSSINGGNLSSFSAANWWSFPALGTVDISNNALTNVSTINGAVYPPPATGVTSLNAQTGVVALISAGSTVTITNPSPGTINLETAAGSGFVTSVNGAPGAITITSDFSTISTSVVGGVTTLSAPTLGVSTDIATTCFGVANSASLSATSAGITANAAAVAAAAAQAAADAAAITAGTALATAGTALAQSGVTFVNGGTFSTTIAAGAGIGVVTTYASGVQNPTITISAVAATAFSYNIYVSNISGNDTTGAGTIVSPFQTIGKAITVANTISDANKVSILLAAGTYTENISITRANTYISGAAPNLSTATNIVGSITIDMTASAQPFRGGGLASVQISNVVYNNSVAANQSYLLSDCLIAPGPGVSAIVATDISPGGNGDLTVQNSLIYVSNVVGISSSNVYIAFITTEITNNPAIIAPISFIQTTAAGRVLILNTTITQNSAASTVAPIINLGNTTTTAFMTVSNSGIRYTSAVSDAGTGGKCCIRCSNTGNISSLILYNNLLICEGATTTTGVPGQFLVLQKSGAGTITVNYGQNSGGATAHHLPLNVAPFTKIAYNNVA